ncbi:MAG: M16 family metallopeptidase, partial [Methylocella sp.]
HHQFATRAEELLHGIAMGTEPQREPPTFSPTSQMADKPLDQTHVILAFDAPGYKDPEIYVLQVLSSLLGGGMSSRLFQEVREKRGLCYSVFSFGSAFEDGGQFGVYAASSPEHSGQLMDVTSNVMLSVADLVTDTEIARAKAQLKASLVMSLESASARADQIARQFMAFGSVPDIATLVAKIDMVTAEQVRGLAQRLFRARVPAFSAVGQLSGLSSYETIVKHFA